MKFKERKSLCEESMLVFVNILKLSSLSLTRRTTSSDDDYDNDNDNNNDHDHDLHQVSSVVQRKKTITNNNSNNQKTVRRHKTPSIVVPVPKMSKRLQKPEQPPESKISYVILPEHDETATVDGKFAAYIQRFHEKTQNDLQNAIVEGRAANYIKRFHEKNMKDLNNESMRRSRYVLPPPPPQVFKY